MTVKSYIYYGFQKAGVLPGVLENFVECCLLSVSKQNLTLEGTV